MFVPVLYSYTYNDKQARMVFYKFKMGNKHEILRSKAKLWGSGGEATGSNRGSGGIFTTGYILATNDQWVFTDSLPGTQPSM